MDERPGAVPSEILFVDCLFSEGSKESVAGALGLSQRSTGREDLLRVVLVRAPRVIVIDGNDQPAGLLTDIRSTRAISQVPLIALAIDAATEVAALRQGADSTASRTVDMRELELRIAAILRRVDRSERPSRHTDHRLELELDRDQRRVWVRGEELSLTPTEFRLLAALLERPGIVISHEELLDAVWSDRFRELSEVKLYVSYVRRKLAAAGIEPIETVRGVGYRYRA